MLLYAPLTVYWFKWFWNLLCFVDAYVDVVDELHVCVLCYHYLGHYIVMVFINYFGFLPIISVLNKLLSCEQGNPEQENSKQLVQHLEFTRMSCFGKTDSITSMLSLLLQSTTPVQLAKYCCVRFHVKINDNND